MQHVDLKSITYCQGCEHTQLTRLFSLGSIPAVNHFIAADQVASEKSYPLELLFCPKCTLVQLAQQVDPKILFSHYLHQSSASKANLAHLRGVADNLRRRFGLDGNSSVLEIGANDGSMLAALRPHVKRAVGVDPAANLADQARSAGVEMYSTFFDTNFAAELTQNGAEQFDVIAAINVVAHTPNFISLFQGVEKALKPNGWFFMEAAYVVETILQGQFDTIYHEHYYNFSLHALVAALAKVGLQAVAAEIIPTQGCSIRVVARRASEQSSELDSSLSEILETEKRKGFTDAARFQDAARRVTSFRSEFTARINKLVHENELVIGLGAPARGVVILNYCQIGPKQINLIVDDTLLKQGRLVPGVHIPVTSWQELKPQGTPAFVLLSWNYKDELLDKLRQAGFKGKILVPFPEITELEC